MITFEIDATRAIARLNAMPEKVRLALQRKRNSLVLQLEAKAKANAPVGPNTPKHTGGQLRRSIHSRIEDTATSVTGFVATGADTPYARIQELGGTIHHPGGTAYIVTKDMAMGALFIKNTTAANFKTPPPRTKPHDITLHGKFYMRDALREMTPAIKAGFTEAVIEGMRE